MLAPFVRGAPVEWLLDPAADPWHKTRAERLAMTGTPLVLQPTAAIRAAWTGKHIGAVEKVEIAALHNGEVLAFRLEWADGSENRDPNDTTAFSDAAAVLFPVVDGAPAISMGGPKLPVNAWYWRGDSDAQGRQVVAEGIGTSRTVDVSLVHTHGVWKDGRWRVVIARALRVQSSEPVVQLDAGSGAHFAVAVWEGSHRERGGIKAFSGAEWRSLSLAPVGGKA